MNDAIFVQFRIPLVIIVPEQTQQQTQQQEEPVPDRWAIDWEGDVLPVRCTGKRDKEPTQLSWAKAATARHTQGRAAELAKEDRVKAQQAPPDQSTDPVRHSLLEGEPVQHVQHIGGDMTKSRDAFQSSTY